MKRYLLLTEILLICFILAGCECGPGGGGKPPEPPSPPPPPSPTPPPPPPSQQSQYFEQRGNNLVYFDGEKLHYLIKGKVESVKFSKIRGEKEGTYYIQVDLKLKDGNLKTSLASLVALREPSEKEKPPFYIGPPVGEEPPEPPFYIGPPVEVRPPGSGRRDDDNEHHGGCHRFDRPPSVGPYPQPERPGFRPY